MKKAKTRYIKNSDGSKKSVLKFRDDHDEDISEEDGKPEKQNKNVGKRFHRKKTAEDEFWDNQGKNRN
ncbi:MAG: hypothetical protein HQK66_01745 [Desulfamplus sp.]|nr:hypothetical protein [Desulfamplus sp.]